jgi:L-ascorbate metabolism protein UlaG (beta-lactamase superfamily)
MEVVWIGASCFRLQTGQVTVLTDPFGFPPLRDVPAADIVSLSLRSERERLAVSGPFRLIDGPGEYEIKGVPVTGIATPQPGAGPDVPPEPNVAYTMTLDGIAIAHLGRLRRMPTAQEQSQLGSPDVLLFVLGEPAGLPAAQAVAVCSQLEAKLLVPVVLGGALDQPALERFCKELGADPTNFDRRLNVSSSGLPAQARVVLLAPTRPSAGAEAGQ